MDINTFNKYYFVGIGGMGMSSLARYFHALGKQVAGYDRTSRKTTCHLEQLGIDIHYQDNPEHIPQTFRNRDDVVVIYTPAVPSRHKELNYFRKQDFTVIKRAAALGLITRSNRSIAVAGTHGKTTISGMTAHILRESNIPVNGFLGGILNNYNSNLLLSQHAINGELNRDDIAVVEADEYDRSFLHLSPSIAIITSVDPDHLDIYGTHENLKNAFAEFAGNIVPEGTIILHIDIAGEFTVPAGITKYTYGIDNPDADFYAGNIRPVTSGYLFDFHGPNNLIIEHIEPRWHSRMNIENAVAAMAASWLTGAGKKHIKLGLESFTGIWRRFDMHINRPDITYIDDYAHHPKEIEKTIATVRDMFPGKKITGIFQPHLYTRTRDFANGFASALNALDELMLLPIYPAREQPIKGVTSELILKDVTLPKMLIPLNEITQVLKGRHVEVVLTMGAGNIDEYVENIKNCLLGNCE